jgi:hypothetical protein
MDLEAKVVKTVDFENGIHKLEPESHPEALGVASSQPTHYADAFADEHYFYLLYQGYSSAEFNDYIYRNWRNPSHRANGYRRIANEKPLSNRVEQYDWNGNLIAKYYLEGNPVERGNTFVVDETHHRFYHLAADCYATFMLVHMCNYALMAYSFPEIKNRYE